MPISKTMLPPMINRGVKISRVEDVDAPNVDPLGEDAGAMWFITIEDDDATTDVG
jgi:hypothetical protein